MNNKIIKISGCSIKLIPRSVSATLTSIYGVGRVRGRKLQELLLNHPRSKKFKIDLVTLSQDSWVQRLFKSFDSDNQLKLAIFNNLERKAIIKCYKARRILQNLPSRGQRTHTNAGTPKRLNPFLVLGVKQSYSQELLDLNKRWELTWNGRSDNLVDLAGNDKKRKKFSNKKKAVVKKKK